MHAMESETAMVTKCMTELLDSKMIYLLNNAANFGEFCRVLEAKYGAKCIIKYKDSNTEKSLKIAWRILLLRAVRETVCFFKSSCLLRLWIHKEKIKFETEQNGYVDNIRETIWSLVL
eukprot:214556_1